MSRDETAREGECASYSDYEEYRKNKLEEGRVFQDLVTSALYQRGIVIVGYASRRFQISHGENLLGAEIKRDGNFRRTGNLYIEVAEKARPRNGDYAASGIYRQDNSWLFVIGDESCIWIFSTKYLRNLEARYHHVETQTSKGYLMPLGDADKYCLRKIEFSVSGEAE